MSSSVLTRYLLCCLAVPAAALPAVSLAQGLPPMPAAPQLVLKVQWQMPKHGVSANPDNRLSQASVATPNLDLSVYGPCNNPNVGGVEVLGQNGSIYPVNLWTGMCAAPVAVTLRDTHDYLDLSGVAQIRWTSRAYDLHAVHPVLKLADGTLVVGDHADSTPRWPGPYQFPYPPLAESSFLVSPQQWYKLNPETLAVMSPVENPDLTKVDAIGFVDLMPSGGSHDAGWSNMGEIDVYGKRVPR